jgi:hypothetical protein
MTPSEVTTGFVTACAAVLAAFVSVLNAVDGFIGRRLLKRNVEVVKHQTNAMNANMVEMATKLGHQKGTDEATHAAEARASALAEGQAQGREQAKPNEHGSS